MMVQRNGTPRFNLGAVIKQTGLSAHTLRVWESRYGLPNPQRSPGGHRLYSERDVAIIQWLMDRRSEGMSISKAVSMWRSLVAEGTDPLPRTRQASGQPATALAFASNITSLRQQWIAACLSFDQEQAELAFSQATAFYSPELAVLEILVPGMSSIGDRWYEGEVTVQQEHFASDLAARRLRSLISVAPAPSREGRLLLALPQGETHDFSLLVIAFLLKRQGWEVISLGADVPFHQMTVTVEMVRPKLVISLAQQLWTAARLQQLALMLDNVHVPVAYGGRIFAANATLRQRIQAHYVGDTLAEVPATVDRLTSAMPVVPPAPVAASQFASLASRLKQSRYIIEATVWQTLGKRWPAELLAFALKTVSRSVEAAAAIGDLELIGAELLWLQPHLVSKGAGEAALSELIAAYGDGMRRETGRDGESLHYWLIQFNREHLPSTKAGSS